MLVDKSASWIVQPTQVAAANSAPAAHAGIEIARLTGIHKTYRQGSVSVHALRGVDITLAEREMVAICGPSGSGKSTLLNLIGMLDEPDQGHVILGAQDVLALSRNAKADLRSAKIGFIFQSFNLIPVLSALENVLLPLRLRGKLAPGAKEQAKALLARVGLGAHLQAYPDKMSGGQRQRVAIARALVTQPQLVIADEPTANLDSETSLMVMDLIVSLRREFATTFVFSTHDSRILGHMTRTVQLRDGRIVEGQLQ
ncbi:MAG: ABC transporter ATP-binding protein [Massilia sp.]